MSKIIQLTAENFKRLVAISITPAGNIVEINGANGSGKSSTLDAIQSALGGKKLSPADPIRHGASSSTVVVETDELIVTRRWTTRGGDSLVVEAKDDGSGNGIKRVTSPQAVLDKLVGGLTFDPLAFSRMEPKKRATLLRQITGLDTTEIDARRREIYDQRTIVNREVAQLEAEFTALFVPPDPGPVGEERDVAAVAGKLADAERVRSANARVREDARRATIAAATAADECRRLEEDLQRARNHHAMLVHDDKQFQLQVAALVDPCTAVIDTEIAAAKAHNVTVRAQQKKADEHARAAAESDHMRDAIEIKQAAAGKLSQQLEAIDARKTRMLAAAKFPVAGMSIDDTSDAGDVLVNGVPFSQASTAEQIRIGLAMGAALNPTLRVVLIRDGSLLDATSLALVAAWAEEKDYQVWMERVAVGAGGVGIEIVDGYVAGAGADGNEPAAVQGELTESLTASLEDL